jgi:hypothetical protein
MSTMETREIPREEWVSFFDTFSRRHERWLATVEIFGDDVGAQVEVGALDFSGMSADLRSGEDLITIDFGGSPDCHLTHTIAHPTRVWLGRKETEHGAAETLDIESEDGVTTLVRFAAP